MPAPSPKQARILLKRYRADLKEVERQIRIVEWLVKGEQKKTVSTRSQ